MAKATAVPAADEKAITKAFPLIAEIKDAELRRGVVKAWYSAWKQSPYKKLEEAPFGADPAPGDTLVKHTNAVADGARSLGEALVRNYGVKVNLDYVLAGGILHDLDKIVMYQKKAGKVGVSDFGKKIVHGAYGAHLALEAGLPQDVVFIIMAHSGSVHVELTSPEGKLISFADLGMIRALQAATGSLPPSGH